jgi:hypothetical protein
MYESKFWGQDEEDFIVSTCKTAFHLNLNTVQEIKSTEDTVTGANAMYKDEKLHE